MKRLFILFLFFLFGFVSLTTTRAASETAKEHATEVAEEKAEVAKEEVAVAEEAAELAQKAAALEEKKAALAKKKAALARKEIEVITTTATLTDQLEKELAKLKAKETERGLVLTLGDVLFETNEAGLKADAIKNLAPLVTFLRANPERNILIEGHTDSTGTESYNLELSKQRAAVVREFLVSNDIDRKRITDRGYGKTYPVTSNDTEAGRQDNRRVEIVVLHEGERAADKMRESAG